MEWFANHLLSTLAVILPSVAVVALLLIKNNTVAKYLSMTVSLLMLAIALHIYQQFDGTSAGLQFVERYEWFPALGISYFLAIDGLSLLLVILTTILMPLLVLSLWRSSLANVRALLALLMFLQCGMLGSLLAFDLVLFYIFWEVMLVPMYFIIGLWGGTNRLYATTKFFIYTACGSLLMLIAGITLYTLMYQRLGVSSTSLLDFYKLASELGSWQYPLLLGFLLAFAIKVPIWPFHTWLPDAHTEAPTVGSVVLAGILLKLGIYGFLRFALPVFPQAIIDFAPFLLVLGVVGIIYGAFTAWAQQDAKRLVAYSSVSHLGFIVIGIFALRQGELSTIALTGAIYQMICHGVSTGALFFLIGVIYQRCHTRQIADYGGLATQMPIFATMLIVATLGSIGLPGTGGFIGEFYILVGTFANQPLVAVCATFGVLLGAIYMLSLCRRLLFGASKHPEVRDVNGLEIAYLLPLIVLVIVMGVVPELFLDKIKPSIEHLAKNFRNYQLAGTNLAQTGANDDSRR